MVDLGIGTGTLPGMVPEPLSFLRLSPWWLIAPAFAVLAIAAVWAMQVVERIIAMVPAPTPVWNDQQRQQARTEHHYEPGRVHP